MEQPDVIVVGDVMLDRTTEAHVRGTSPEDARALVVCEQGIKHGLGGAGNVAATLAGLGKKVQLFGVVGDDREGHTVCRLCEEAGITGVMVARGHVTTVKHRIVTPHGQVLRVDRELCRPVMQLPCLYGATLQERLDRTMYNLPLAGAGTSKVVVVVSDYGKGVIDQHHLEWYDWLRQRCVRVLVDPCDHLENWSNKNALLKMNRSQAMEFLGADAAHLPAAMFIQSLDVGLEEYTGLYHYVAAASSAGEVADVCGAGDTVLAVLADFAVDHGLCGDTLTAWAVDLANAAAGLVVRRRGVYVLSADELKAVADRKI